MRCLFILLAVCLSSCNPQEHSESENQSPVNSSKTGVELIILGNVQDGGSPHIGCRKDCCKDLWNTPDLTRKVVCLGLIDHDNEQTFLFEATPNITGQLRLLSEAASFSNDDVPSGIFISHAHLGHYTGLAFLGREAKGAESAKVYAMPKMAEYLTNNGPWSQLVGLKNIVLAPLKDEQAISVSENIRIEPFLVPHRDEFSETVGYKISGPKKSALFIPDIDKWEKWQVNIDSLIQTVDYAFLDGTFYDAAEVNHRDVSEIPHPFISESMKRFESLPDAEKAKINFIHFNHTNPVLDPESDASKTVEANGFRVARFGERFGL